MSKQTLTIYGMKCDTCVSTVRQALTETAGVSEVSVGLEAGAAEVEYDPNQASLAQLTDAVRQAGFDAKPAE
jgi:copper chaperone CopZ